MATKRNLVTPDQSTNLDRTDKKILVALQDNGRITYSQLAEQIGLTTSPCIERVKRLELEGYIEGYTAQLSAEKLNVALVVFVQIRLDRTSKDSFNQFKRRVLQLKYVQECYLVTGNFDYLIKARLADMDAYREFLEEELLSIPGVQASTSIVAMDTVKESLMLDL